MIKKLTKEEIKSLTKNTFKDELEDNEFFLFHSIEIDMGPMCHYDNHIWSHSNDLDSLKSLYQNVILKEFISSLCYNDSYDIDDYDLYELIELKENDFEFRVENQSAFNEFKELIKNEPNSFDELKLYVKRTSELLEKAGIYCEAKLYENFDLAFEQIFDDYCGEIPVFETDIEYIKHSSYQ